MPAELTAHTGLDALSHAIESCVSEASRLPQQGPRRRGDRGLVRYLPRAVQHPLDLDAREAIARASLQAGLAFTNALLGATHAIAHQIGGALDLPHGLLNAILMPHVMRFNAETHADRYVDVAWALGVPVADLTPAAAAEAAIGRVEALARALEHPRRAPDAGRRSGRVRALRGQRAARRLYHHQPSTRHRAGCPRHLRRRLLTAPGRSSVWLGSARPSPASTRPGARTPSAWTAPSRRWSGSPAPCARPRTARGPCATRSSRRRPITSMRRGRPWSSAGRARAGSPPMSPVPARAPWSHAQDSHSRCSSSSRAGRWRRGRR